MVWDLIQQSRKEGEDLAIVWLDLANAYGSVPHAAIMFALEFFWIPEKVVNIIKAYLDVYRISFKTPTYRSKDVRVEKGVAAGDTISPLLFVMVKEIVTKAASHSAGVIRCPRLREKLPPIRAFMDDLTCAQDSYEGMVALLKRLEEMIGWVRMQFKPKKCRALVLRKGRVVEESFEVGDGEGMMRMPSVLEKPVKCLGRLYTAALSDSDRKDEIRKDVEDGLRIISDCKLQGTVKCWIYQFGLLPRIMWPMIMYEIPLTAVEEMERLISKHLRRWLCLPPEISSVAFYGTSTKLKLPLRSVVEEYKVGKCRTVVSLAESKDPVVQGVQPDVRTGSKWKASEEVAGARFDVSIDKLVGAVPVGRQGLGFGGVSKPSSPRLQITAKVKSNIEHGRYVTACQQPSQGRWTNWNDIEVRELSWSELWNVSDKRISMMIKSAYDVLGTPANLKTWNLQESDKCVLCDKAPCNLKHILSNCSVALVGGRYTWRHDRVLKCIVSVIDPIVNDHNSKPGKPRNNAITFLRKGQARTSKAKAQRPSVLGTADDWVVVSDLETQLVVPREIAITSLRPDVVLWSKKGKTVVLCELTCPWEENAEWAHERKLTKYEGLKNEIANNGWSVKVFAVEVGCRGFASRSLRSFLTAIGGSNRKIKSALKECCEVAERASVDIYLSRNDRWSKRDV